MVKLIRVEPPEFPHMVCGDRVVIKRFEVQETSQGGIVLPGISKPVLPVGVVCAVGGGKSDPAKDGIPRSVRRGDIVHFAMFSGITITLDGNDYVVVREREIILVEAQPCE